MTVQETTLTIQKKKNNLSINLDLPIKMMKKLWKKTKNATLLLKIRMKIVFLYWLAQTIFSSNIAELIGITGTVLDAINFRVDAFLRVLPAKTSFNSWDCTPR